MLDGDSSRDPVPPLGRPFYPEQGDLGLVGGASGAVHSAQTLHFIEIRRVFLAGHGVGRLRPVLRAGGEHEGSDLSPIWKSGEREPGYELEVPRIGSWDVGEIKEGRGGRPIRVSEIEDSCGCCLADQDPLRLGRGIWDRRERRRVGRLDELDGCIWREAQFTGELREQRDEHVACSRRHCSFGGRARWCLGVESVRLGPPIDRIQRIVDCDVHHGKDPRFMERVYTPGRIVQAGSEGGAGGSGVPVNYRISRGTRWRAQDEKH